MTELGTVIKIKFPSEIGELATKVNVYVFAAPLTYEPSVNPTEVNWLTEVIVTVIPEVLVSI